MNALLITLGVYAVPIFTHGIWWFAQMTFLSFIYIVLIYHCSKIRERAWLIVIEFINLAFLFAYFVEYCVTHTKSFVTVYSPLIIQACFFLELLIIIGGLLIGVRKRNQVLRNSHTNSDSFYGRNHLFN